MEKERDMVLKYGQISQNTLGSEKTTKPMEKANCIMQMEIFMKVSGKMIKQMEKVFIYMQMVLNMLDNGKKTNNMAEV